MIISLKHRFIFIKGVKVAGTSVETYLSQILEAEAIVAPLGDADEVNIPKHRARNYLSSEGRTLFDDHMPASAIRAVIGTWLYEQLYKFGIIRNPFQKIISFYIMNLARKPNYTVQQAIEECESESVRLCDGNSMIVHCALFYENLERELIRVFQCLGVPFTGSLGYTERSDHRKKYAGPPVTFTKAQVDQIAEKFSFELDLYQQAGQPLRALLPS